jgi:hypothetical protein
MFACGGNSNSKNTTPPATTDAPVVDTSGPPWNNLSAQEKEMYENDHACTEATNMMNMMMTWPIMEYAEEVSPGRFIITVQSASGMVGVIQYREGETLVVEMGLVMLSAEDAVVLLDYEVLRAFHTGAASSDNEDALSLATGEYFCVYM